MPGPVVPAEHVLIGLASRPRELGSVLADSVRDLGYEPRLSQDGEETLRWARGGSFAASLLDVGLAGTGGQEIWRDVHRIVGRRLVLMTEEPRGGLWFEALGQGVAAVLSLPAQVQAVHAAIHVAVHGAPSDSPTRWRGPGTA